MNASSTISALIENISHSIASLDKDEANNFNTHYLSIVTHDMTLREAATGISPLRQLNSLVSTMQHFGNESPLIGAMIWNPIVASMITTIREACLSDDKQFRNDRTTVTSGKPTSRLVKPIGQDKTRSTVTTTPNPTKHYVDVRDQHCPTSVMRTVRQDLVRNSESIFRNLRHVKCTSSSCKFCLDLAMVLPITKCSEIKCHKRNTVCHPSGWYVHVLPNTWLSIRKNHDAGKPFCGIRDLDMAEATPTEPNPSSSNNAPPPVESPMKRARPISYNDENSLSSNSLSELLAETSSRSWADMSFVDDEVSRHDPVSLLAD